MSAENKNFNTGCGCLTLVLLFFACSGVFSKTAKAPLPAPQVASPLPTPPPQLPIMIKPK